MKNISNLFIILVLSVSFAATPTLTDLSNSNYNEQGPVYILDADVTVANGLVYSNMYLEFSITNNADSGDNFSLNSSGTPNSADNISIDGTDIYLGQGGSKTLIGRVDGTKNGIDGQPYRINFNNATLTGTPAIVNGDFSSDLNNWTAVRAEINLGENLPSTSIATPNDADVTYPPSTPGNDDDDLSSGGERWEVDVISGRLRLQERSMTVTSYGVVHGPAAYSDIFSAQTGGLLKFDWEANNVADDYHVTGYLIDTSNNITIALDATGTTGSGTASITVPMSANYRFVFISGTFDATGGRAAGASMYIDNVRVEDAMIVDSVVETIIENILYSNSSDNPSANKTLTVSTQNSDGNTASATSTITITAINDAPVSNNVNGSGNEGGTITTTLTATDPDRTIGNFLIFDGIDDRVNFGDIDALDNPAAMTVAFWFKRSVDQAANSNHATSNVMYAKASNPANDNIEIGTDGTSVEIYLDSVEMDGDGDAPNNSLMNSYNAGIQNSNWYHLVFTYDKNDADGNEGRLYINGSNVNSWSHWGGNLDQTGSSPITIGDTDHTETPFNGSMDEIIIWNTALSAAEISDVYNRTNPKVNSNNYNSSSNLVAYWNLDEGTGSTTNDQSVNNHDGTLSGNPQWDQGDQDLTFSVVSQPTNITSGTTVSIGTVSCSSGTCTADATYTHDDTQTTSDSFTYKTYDGTAYSNIANASISITPVNDASITSNINGNGSEGGTITTTLTASDIDNSDPNSFTFIVASQPTNISGSISIGSVSYSSGSFSAFATYTHDGSETTSDSFTYKANDGSDDSNTSTATITITPVNDAPVANNDSYSVNEAATLNQAVSGGVLTNDSDAENNSLTAILVNSVLHGTLTLSSDGSFSYVNDGSEASSDSFTYKAYDGNDQSNVATISLTIAAINDAPVTTDVTGSGNEGSTITTILTATDPDNSDPNSFTFEIIYTDMPEHMVDLSLSIGSYTYNAGTFSAIAAYTHDGTENFSDEFTYKAYDDDMFNSNISTATITITPVNDAPVATSVTGTGNEAGTITTTLKATDADIGAIVTFDIISYPSYYTTGTMTITKTNNLEATATYTHDGTEPVSPADTDSFRYKANDGSADSNVATATISPINQVNDPPVAAEVTGSGCEAGLGACTGLTTVTLQATDLDQSASVTFNIVSGSGPADISGAIDESASVTSSSGTFSKVITYTQNGYSNALDSLKYTATDGIATSSEATATLSIQGTDDIPATEATSSTVIEGGTISTIELKATDEDESTADGCDSTMTFSIVEQPSRGTIIGDPSTPTCSGIIFTSLLTYTHDGSESTSDSFTYKAYDNIYYSNIETVSITITPSNDPPSPNNDFYSVNEGDTLSVAASGILANDTDEESDSFTAVLDINVLHGTLTLNPDGSFKYIHDGSETTSDSLKYKAADATGTSISATVTISITPVNDAPVANADSFSVNEGGTLTDILRTNDTDADNDTNTLTARLISNVTHGILTLDEADGSFTYVHDSSEGASDTLQYQCKDDALYSNTQTAIITIIPVNDPPVTTNVTGSGAEGGIITTILTATDVDNSDPNSFTFIVSQPTNIVSSTTISVDTVRYSSGTFTAVATYTHDGSETISDSFTYQANDGDVSNTSTATITIIPVNDPPQLVEISTQTTNEDVPDTLTLSVIDPDNSSHTFTAVSLESSDIITYVDDSILILSTSPNWNGTSNILVEVEEGGSEKLTNSKSFTFIIEPMNDPPSDIVLTSPSDKYNVLLNSTNLSNTALSLEWSESIDMDRDSLTYIFHAEWDTTDQLNHPPTIILHEEIQGTQLFLHYSELYSKLDYNNRIWLNTPVMQWKVDVTDGIDTIDSPEIRNVNISFYGNLSLDNKHYIPNKYTLYQNYPNPFNPRTRINYDLPNSGLVHLIIYNLLGQKVITLVNEQKAPGRYSIIWNGQDKYNRMVSSGVYFYHLSTPEFSKTKKMIILK